jgi:hypothetical protein
LGFVFERKEKKQERPIYAWLLIDGYWLIRVDNQEANRTLDLGFREGKGSWNPRILKTLKKKVPQESL